MAEGLESVNATNLWWIKAGAGAFAFFLAASAFWWSVPKLPLIAGIQQWH
jgi:hypothetical protein